MKQFLINAFVFLISCDLYSQAGATLTYDAANNVNQVKNHITLLEHLSEAVQQSSILTKTLEYAEKAQKALSRVNAALNDVFYVESIINREIYIVDSYSSYLNSAKSFKYVTSADLSYFSNSISQLLNNAEKLIDLANRFIEDGYFDMNDISRLNSLESADRNMSNIQTSLDIAYQSLLTKEKAGALYESFKEF
ncbi:MAG: hypothetical protein JXB49_17230 [Bacteroidales bacterium]|nr:hypothetical protein [Bacteroidales bacterium]